MAKEKALDILKKALLLEYRGKTFYGNAAKNSENEEVKEIFKMMVEEEDKHAEKLTKLFNDLTEGNVTELDLSEKPTDISDKIITEKIKNDVSASGFESAAISAAIAMEKEAIDFYTQSEDQAETEEEKKLYRWLADWEKGHARFLSDIDKEIMENIWYDNKFWPLA